jgi:hypothetical protein
MVEQFFDYAATPPARRTRQIGSRDVHANFVEWLLKRIRAALAMGDFDQLSEFSIEQGWAEFRRAGNDPAPEDACASL